MRILVTGAKGFIGTAVRSELFRRGHEAVTFDLPSDSVLDRNRLQDAVEATDGVINLAGALGTAELIGSEHDAVQANIVGALNVADACGWWDRPLVQIGTGHKGQPNPYAITKACAEELLLARARWERQRITVVRAYHVYGPGQKASPPYGPGHVRKIGPTFICAALSGDPLEVNGSGKQLIDLVHVDDVAAVLVDALDGPYGTVVEAGTGVATSVLQAAQDVITAAGSDSEIRHIPMRRGEPDETTVVALDPVCPNPWPHRLGEVVGWYRGFLK